MFSFNYYSMFECKGKVIDGYYSHDYGLLYFENRTDTFA